MSPSLKKQFHLSKLIAKYYAKALTSDEASELKIWLESDKDNNMLFKKILEKHNIEKSIKKLQSFDIDKELIEIHKRINQLSNERRINYFNWIKYAAAIFIPLFLATYIYHQFPKVSQEEIIRQYSEVYQPGSSKATLIDEEGNSFELNDTSNVLLDNNIIKIQNTGKYVKYEILSALASNELPLKESYHKIEVPTGGEYLLELADGTKIWLNSETKIRYPRFLVGTTRTIELVGEAYFEVAHNPDKPFIVKTSKGNVKVLGTEFNIKAYKNEINYTTLINGSVSIKNKLDDKTQKILVPGQQAKITDKEGEVEVTKVQTYDYTAWKDSRFVFNSQRLEDILHVISRWYGAKFELDSEVKNIVITADIRKYNKLSTILAYINSSTQKTLKYETNGDTMYITVKN